MDRPEAEASPRRGVLTRPRLIAAAAIGVLVLALVGFTQVRAHQMQARMVRTFPNDVPKDARLSRLAADMAKPLYDKDCAACHGADMKGDPKKGAPNLTDAVWLFGAGEVSDIEQTILYGVRSGHGKSHNVTDMPALGLSGQLYPYEAKDVAEYVIYLSTGKSPGAEVIKRGAAIFQDKGVCYDCHSTDAQGNSDYGAPAFTDKDWTWGGDYESVYHSIYYGRHGLCPAWIDKLSAAQIRALAVYLHNQSHKSPAATAAAPAGDHHG